MMRRWKTQPKGETQEACEKHLKVGGAVVLSSEGETFKPAPFSPTY